MFLHTTQLSSVFVVIAYGYVLVLLLLVFACVLLVVGDRVFMCSFVRVCGWWCCRWRWRVMVLVDVNRCRSVLLYAGVAVFVSLFVGVDVYQVWC